MNVTRTLVTILLVSSVAVGFVQVLSTQSALGVITSYSTMTSTSFEPFGVTMTGTRFTTTIARTLTQEYTTLAWTASGQYVKHDLSFQYMIMGGLNQAYDLSASGSVANLMTVIAQEIRIVIRLSNKAKTTVENVTLTLFGVQPGSTQYFVNKPIPFTKTFLHGDFYLGVLGVVIVCDGVTITTPVTYAVVETRTYTRMTTGTIAYTISEPPGPLGSAEWILLLTVAAGAIIAVFVFTRRKGPAPDRKEEIPAKPSVQEQKPSLPTEEASKSCRNCGAPISAGSTFCSECGKKL